MITKFNDFTLSHTISHHQLSPDAKEEQSASAKEDRIHCPLCNKKDRKDTPSNRRAIVRHLIKNHWNDKNVKEHISNVYPKTASTPQAQANIDSTIKKRHAEIDKKLAKEQ
jgi:MarR-like DNA-binding transcriptional regulator SgrR of sgrS sRNA